MEDEEQEPAAGQGIWPPSLFDVLALVGVLCLSAGAYWIYAPMGLIVLGALVLCFAVWAS